MRKEIERFLTALEASNYSKHTLRGYERDLRDFAAYMGDVALGEMNRRQVRAFVRHLYGKGLARTSMRRKIECVKSFFRWSCAEDLIPENVSLGVVSPKVPERLPDLPTQAEISQLLDGKMPTPFPERDRALLELLYATGIRVAEVCGIDMKDFEAPDLILVRGKGRRERRVIYGECARAALEAYLPLREKVLAKKRLKTSALFFSFGPHLGLERLDVRSVGRILKQVAERKGLSPEKYHSHMLRHCFSTHCHDNGMPIEVVSKLLGHVNLSTTVVYTQVSTARMLDAYRKAHPHARAA